MEENMGEKAIPPYWLLQRICIISARLPKRANLNPSDSQSLFLHPFLGARMDIGHIIAEHFAGKEPETGEVRNLPTVLGLLEGRAKMENCSIAEIQPNWLTTTTLPAETWYPPNPLENLPLIRVHPHLVIMRHLGDYTKDMITVVEKHKQIASTTSRLRKKLA